MMVLNPKKKKRPARKDILWARFQIEVIDDERCPLIEG